MRVNDGTKPLQNDFIQTKTKKKIKDLTLEEKNKICNNYSYCHSCPLSFLVNRSIVCCKDVDKDVDLEKEVEVDD